MSYSNNLKFTLSDVEYTWEGGLGSVVCSYEKGLKRGEIRMIGDILFYVFSISKTRFYRKPKVTWSPCNKNSNFEDLKSIKRKLFNCEQ